MNTFLGSLQAAGKPSLEQRAEVPGRVLAGAGLLCQVTEHLTAHRIDGLAVPGPELRGRHIAVRLE
jgi:hypothetical protein